MEKLIQRAENLIESLPYIKTFSSKTFVIKYGGSAMKNPELRKSIIQDIILLKYIGIKPVIVHGGGYAITKYLDKMGIKSEFINGLRVTSQEVIDVVQMVLVGKINQEIVSLLNKFGGMAVGLSGKDGNIMLSRKHLPEIQYDKNGDEIKTDLGFVGEIEKIDCSIITKLCENGVIPVISPIGVGIDGESYNINADTAAGHIAQSLNAEKLIMLTDTDGIYEVPDKKSTKINVLTSEKADEMIKHGQIHSGMIPKVKSCINAVRSGVNRTHIIDGKEKHSMLIEVFTDQGIGTMVIED